MSVTSGVTVITVIDPPVTTVAGGGSSGRSGGTTIAAATLEAKLDRIVHMVTTSQKTTQQSIEALRAEFRKEQEETAEKAAKKARLSAEVTFRRKGNERQYRFNESLQEQFQVTHARLEEATNSEYSFLQVLSGLRQALLAVEEGMRLLKLRQKAIRLADRSEFGWSLVAEYDADELADDSNDERKIEKAAEQKASMAKKKRSRSVQQSASLGREVPFNHYHQSRREPEVVPVLPHHFLGAKCAKFQVQVPVSIVGSLTTLEGIVSRCQEEQLQHLNSIL